MALEADQVLNNRYRIMKLLGEGGFGEVYQAWDTRLDAPCAVKRNLQPSFEARRQFEQEARMLFKLIHQNLPRVHDYFTGHQDEQYLVMDFVEGENLRNYLHRVGIPPTEQALIWIDQVSDALNYLHTRQPPVVHRDIKPANIIITPELKAMLVDFGIAKADPQMRTLSGARAWTPGYAPPEQYGQGRTDARSDVYSLAATAYALLTGESPPDAMDVAAGNLRPARPVAELNPVVPAYVSRAIAKAMLFNREQRTATVDEFRQALRKKTKPASERVIVPESQKTILEPRQETPPAPKQDSAPPPTQEKTKPPAPVVPVDTPPLEELLQAAAPAILVEKAPEEGKASPPETPPSAEKTRIEEHPLPPEPSQPAAPVLGVEEMPVVEEAPVYVPPFIQEQQPVESSPVEMKPVPPAVRQPAWQKLGWKGIGAILAVIVILAIVIGVLLNPGDPQGSEDPDGAAAAATVTLRDAVNLPATHNASVATATATQTPPVVLEATATVANRLLDARSTATVQTLSRFKEARTQTALAKLAGGAEPTMAPTTTPRPVIKTATPTPTKKPKKKDDGQITLEPGLTLVP